MDDEEQRKKAEQEALVNKIAAELDLDDLSDDSDDVADEEDNNDNTKAEAEKAAEEQRKAAEEAADAEKKAAEQAAAEKKKAAEEAEARRAAEEDEKRAAAEAEKKAAEEAEAAAAAAAELEAKRATEEAEQKAAEAEKRAAEQEAADKKAAEEAEEKAVAEAEATRIAAQEAEKKAAEEAEAKRAAEEAEAAKRAAEQAAEEAEAKRIAEEAEKKAAAEAARVAQEAENKAAEEAEAKRAAEEDEKKAAAEAEKKAAEEAEAAEKRRQVAAEAIAESRRKSAADALAAEVARATPEATSPSPSSTSVSSPAASRKAQLAEAQALALKAKEAAEARRAAGAAQTEAANRKPHPVKVYVRAAPLSSKDTEAGATSIVTTTDDKAVLMVNDPDVDLETRYENFSGCFSGVPQTPAHMSQENLYKTVVAPLLDDCFNDGGDNSLIVMGQKGSGKKFMLYNGAPEQLGLLQLLFKDVFTRIVSAGLDLDADDDDEDDDGENSTSYQVALSCIEIGNDRSMKDLLQPQPQKRIIGGTCDDATNFLEQNPIVEHPSTGAVAHGATQAVVHNFEDTQRIVEESSKLRDDKNNTHNIITLAVYQKKMVSAAVSVRTKAEKELVGSVSIVDVAVEHAEGGSQLWHTASLDEFLEESLNTEEGAKKAEVLRSTDPLTWLVKERITGNAKTAVIGTLSGADYNFDATMYTLRLTEKIAKHHSYPVGKEETSKRIGKLRLELEALQSSSSDSPVDNMSSVYDTYTTKQKLSVVEKLIEILEVTWDEREDVSTELMVARTTGMIQRTLNSTTNSDVDGAAPSSSGKNVGVHQLKLVLLLEEITAEGKDTGSEYKLAPGRLVVGAERRCDVKLDGIGILPQHATLEVSEDGTVKISPAKDEAQIRVNGDLITADTTLKLADRVVLGLKIALKLTSTALEAQGITQELEAPLSTSYRKISQYTKAMEECFEKNRVMWMKGLNQAPLQDRSAVPFAAIAGAGATEEAVLMKITELQRQVDSMMTAQQTNLTDMLKLAGAETLNRSGGEGGAASGSDTDKKNSLADIVTTGNRVSSQRWPPQQIFKHKVVLIGHQEVGKTSVRKCMESDPMFFKSLPDVQTTSGIETCDKRIMVDNEPVDLQVQDFAGQEAYASHSLFLTDRTVFCLVWKISAIEQDFNSRGINEGEEQRLYKWVTEIYSKHPHAPLCLVATHLDELRDRSQKTVGTILAKVQVLIIDYINKISRKHKVEGQSSVKERSPLPIIGNFVVSCKERIIMSMGPHIKLSGKKISSMLNVIAIEARANCEADPVYWGGAIPGRHIRLIKEVLEYVKKSNQLLLPLAEYVHMALRLGIESDQELMQATQLMHSWNILFMFNQHSISMNPFLMLHPVWLSRMAGVILSFAHVINTPQHLRSSIGGLEYGQSAAENAGMGMMKSGFVRLPLARIIFKQCLSSLLKRPLQDTDFEICLKILAALEMCVPVTMPIEDPMNEAYQDEARPFPLTPANSNCVLRYFVYSQTPFFIPDTLRRTAGLIFNRGLRVSFDFNLLPTEMWWRLQFRLEKYLVSLECTALDEDAEDDSFMFTTPTLPESGTIHNRWRDALLLGNDSCRILLVREGPTRIRVYSAEIDANNNDGTSKGSASEPIFVAIEEEVTALLKEYQGVQRTLRVQCPVQECSDGYLEAAQLPKSGTVGCVNCLKQMQVNDVVFSGTGSLGPKSFPPEIHREVVICLESLFGAAMVQHICNFFGILNAVNVAPQNVFSSLKPFVTGGGGSSSGSASDSQYQTPMKGGNEEQNLDNMEGSPEADGGLQSTDFMKALDKIVKYHMMRDSYGSNDPRGKSRSKSMMR